MKLFAYRYAEVIIFGLNGIDLRSRLAIVEEVQKTKPDMSGEESGEYIRSILPLHYGNKFPRLAVMLTLIFGIAFYYLLPSSIIAITLHYREWTNIEFLNYLLLVLQWYIFYIIVSILSVGVTVLLAFVLYAKRTQVVYSPN